jgi:hypothetical protein
MGRVIGRSWWSSAAGGALALSVLFPVTTQLTSAGAGGCDTSRTATVYSGDGSSMSSSSRVTPCLSSTGFGGAETSIVSTSSGALFYEPAIVTPGLAGTGFAAGLPGPRPSTQLSPGGLALSRDHGSSWQFVEPSGQTWVPQDDALYADWTTGWLYYYALSPDPVPQSGTALEDQLPAGYAQINASPDEGRTWYHTSIPGYVEAENPRFASAPVPAGGAGTADGSDVVYWCGNDMLFAPSLGAPSYRACYRSLDRGLTWSFASILFSTPVPRHPECGTNGENFSASDGNYPEGAPDGSLYVEVDCGSTTYLARSTDEGATWPIVVDRSTPVTLPADGELRIDPAGNFYLVALEGDALDLWVSTDHGESWSAPHDMTVPGASSVYQWAVAERGTGEVAVSYLARSPSGTGYDGFLSVTQDALDTNPTFYGTTLDAPGTPVYAGTPPQARDDFIGVDISPDGTPWASFYGSCAPGDPDPGCSGQSGNPLANKALVGHLGGLGPLP